MVDVFTTGSCMQVAVVDRGPVLPVSGLLSFPVMLAVESNVTGVIFPVDPDFCRVLIGRIVGAAVGAAPPLGRLKSSLLTACTICCAGGFWVIFGIVDGEDALAVWLSGVLPVLTGAVFIGVIVSVIGRLSGLDLSIGAPVTVGFTGVIVVVLDSVLPASGCKSLIKLLDCLGIMFNGFINLLACCCWLAVPTSLAGF